MPEQRLINASKITDEEIDEYGWFDHEQIKDIHMLIDAQDTVDAVPVVHGFWKQDENKRCRCSNCHAVKEQYYDWYCGYCGAKMDGKDGENDAST